MCSCAAAARTRGTRRIAVRFSPTYGGAHGGGQEVSERRSPRDTAVIPGPEQDRQAEGGPHTSRLRERPRPDGMKTTRSPAMIATAMVPVQRPRSPSHSGRAGGEQPQVDAEEKRRKERPQQRRDDRPQFHERKTVRPSEKSQRPPHDCTKHHEGAETPGRRGWAWPRSSMEGQRFTRDHWDGEQAHEKVATTAIRLAASAAVATRVLASPVRRSEPTWRTWPRPPRHVLAQARPRRPAPSAGRERVARAR